MKIQTALFRVARSVLSAVHPCPLAVHPPLDSKNVEFGTGGGSSPSLEKSNGGWPPVHSIFLYDKENL